MRFYDPRPQFFINGIPASGAKLFFYIVGTTTKKNTYTDSTKGTANPNPVILDSQGRPDNGGSPIDIFLDGAYKVVFAPSTDTDPPASPIWTVSSVTTLGQLESTSAKSDDYIVLETDRDKTILMNASGGAKTITLLAASTAGDGFAMTIKKTDSTGNAVILDGNGSETIDGSATYSITVAQGAAKIVCDGSNWHIQYKGVNASEVTYEDSRTNSVAYPFTVTATTSGSPAAGIGTGLKLYAESADENPSAFGSIAFYATDVTAGTEDTALVVQLRVAGAALADAYKFAVTGTGNYTVTGAPSAGRTVTLPDASITIGGTFVTGAAFTLGNQPFEFSHTGAKLVIGGTLTGTRTITVPDSNVTISTPAAQADMEAQSAGTTYYVAPDKVVYNPGVAKAWLRATVSGGVPGISTSMNIASIDDDGTGDFGINFTTAFSSTSFCGVGTASNTGASADTQYILATNTQGTSNYDILIVVSGDASVNNAFVDPDSFHLAFFGDRS